MIKPATLWSQFKTCDDSEWLGTLCRALGGQDVKLDYGQRQMLAAIQMDSGWMDERIEEKREAWRARQQKKRDKRDLSQSHACHAEERDECDACDNGVICDLSQSHACHDTSVHPSVRPSIHPNNRTEPDNTRASTYVRVCEGARPATPSGSGSARGIDVYGISDADLFGCKYDTLSLYKAAFGDGFWASALRTLGDGVMLDALSTFVHEVRAGEMPKNPAAIMTIRLKRLLDAATKRKENPQ